jgi:hypothetical protein
VAFRKLISALDLTWGGHSRRRIAPFSGLATSSRLGVALEVGNTGQERIQVMGIFSLRSASGADLSFASIPYPNCGIILTVRPHMNGDT